MTSLGMLINWVKIYSKRMINQGFYPDSIDWICVLPPDVECVDDLVEEGTVIVFDDEDDATLLNNDIPAIYVYSERISTFSENRNNTILARTEISKQKFAHLLQNRIRAVNRWEHELDRISAERGSYQDMLDASAEMLGNMVTMTDATYHLLAYTKGMPVDDPLTVELIERGYHGERAIEKFRQSGAFKRWASQRKSRYHEAGMMRHPSINHVFTVNDSYFIQMVMTCSNTPYSQGLMDTFEILVNHMNAHIRRCRSLESEVYAEGARFFTDMIQGRTLPRRVIAQQTHDLGLSAYTSFRLCAIRGKSENAENLTYVAGLIASSLERCFVIPIGDLVYVVAYAMEDREDAWKAFVHVLATTVDEEYVDIAVSGPLGNLEQLSHGALQTEIAFKFGKGRPNFLKDMLERPDSVSRFDNALFDYLLFSKERDLDFLRFCYDTSILARIRAHSSKTPGDDVILRYYLKYECSPSLTADALGVHRNTVLNRINAMEKHEGIELADPKTRLSLTTLFHLSDLLGCPMGPR